MTSSLEEFFQKLHRDVTLPSGLVVAVRKPDMWVFLPGGRELPIPAVPAPAAPTDVPAPNPMTVRDLDEYTERAIAGGVIAPPMSCGRDAQGDPIYSPHYVHVSELPLADKTFLGNLMMELLGLTPEVATSLDAFRADGERQEDPGPSRTLSNIAE